MIPFGSKPLLPRLQRPTAALIGALLCASTAPALAADIAVDGRDFVPLRGTAPFSESPNSGSLRCSGAAGPDNLFFAQLHLPPGDLDLRRLAAWGQDNASVNATVNLVRICQLEFTASSPVRTLLATVASSGTPGNFFLLSNALNIRVDDQHRCVYLLEAQLGLNGCVGGSLELAKVRVSFDPVVVPVIDELFADGFEI